MRSRLFGRAGEAGFTLLEIMVTIGIIAVVSATAVPMVGNAMASLRLSGDTRAISNSISVAKLRAASDFSHVRLYVDLDGSTFSVQLWDKTTNTWTTEGGATHLATGSSFSYGVVSTPPPNTQGTIGQAPQCTDNAGAAISGTACIMFNSRGLAIDSSGAPTPLGAIYLTNGMEVHAVTVSATGMGRVWRTKPVSTPAWVLQ